MNNDSHDDSTAAPRKCSVCGGTTTYKDRNKWGQYEHWYGTPDSRICKKCFIRSRWQARFVPVNTTCCHCGSNDTTLSKYGTPNWVKNRKKGEGYLCRSCFTISRNKGRDYSDIEYRRNLKKGIKRALDSGVEFGRRKYFLNETVFDKITEKSSYWIGYLMADGSVEKGKTGNPRIALTLAEIDRGHLNKFANFLGCSYRILPKIVNLNGRVIRQYYLRFSCKHIAEVLMKCGIVPKKSLIAKVIGLVYDRHFWRGVVDGDGWIGVRNGHDVDKIILTGSYFLLCQFKKFIEKNIQGAIVRIKQEGRFSRLYVYSITARMLARLLYHDCRIALERKLKKAHQMYQ